MKLNVSREANPIVVKELRSRMRGWRAFAVLTGVLLHACCTPRAPMGNAPLLPFLTPVFLKVKLSC